MPINITVPGGGSIDAYLAKILKATTPKDSDVLLIANQQKTRILERTLAGKDVEGRPFKPYSTRGPYYWYPTHGVRGAKLTTKQRKAAVSRLFRITTPIAAHRAEFLGSTSVGGVKTKSGLGICFESYADFKQAIGRSGGVVDLTGPFAPHMLQAIVIAKQGDGVKLGIYGAEGPRASGHNTGTRHLPQRRFFGIGKDDMDTIKKDLELLTIKRLRAALGGNAVD